MIGCWFRVSGGLMIGCWFRVSGGLMIGCWFGGVWWLNDRVLV